MFAAKVNWVSRARAGSMLVIFLLMSGALLPGGEISRLSLSSEGDEDDRTCRAPQVSADGSVVAF